MKKSGISFFAAITASIVLLAGCAGIRSDFQERNFFRITVPANAPDAANITKGEGLLVRGFDIAPEFESTSFVYRVSSSRFTGDYFNKFMVSPAHMISDAVRETLFASTCFKPVPANEPARIRYRLWGKVLALYGDIRMPDQPKAVMTLRLTLEEQTGNGFAAVINNDYPAVIPVDRTDQASLVDAWNRCLEKIILNFIEDVKDASMN